MITLNRLELPFKLLITMFLIVLSWGFLVSELYLLHTTEMADGKPGMSIDDITYTFHGSKTLTTLKKKINGSMRPYFFDGGDEKNATLKDYDDIEAVLKWNESGAAEEGYWDPKLKAEDKNPKAVVNILYTHGCYDCHAADATMKGHKKDSPLDTFANISKFLKPDLGMDKGRLLMLSHAHLLGMGIMYLITGTFVAFTLWPRKVRIFLIVGGLSAILFNIGGWWAVKYGGPAFSYLVMFGGGMMAVTFGLSVAAAAYDLWIRKPVPAGGEPPVLVDHAPQKLMP